MADRGAYANLDRPPLDVRTLRRALRADEPGSWWRRVDVVAETGSTNADVADAARDGAAEGTVLVAEHQRTGRGRLGRRWEAPRRSALTLSVLVRPRIPATRWPWLPLLTGVAVAEAVRRVAEVDAVVKWPNDVLVDDRKLAGILLERVETSDGPAAVLGIGLNVSGSRAELPVPAATSLLLEGAGNTDRHTVLVTVLRTLHSRLTAWTGAGDGCGTGLHASYVRSCATLGRQVQVKLPDGSSVTGRADTVDTGGRLVVLTASGRRVLGAGDVLHVRADEPPSEPRSGPPI